MKIRVVLVWVLLALGVAAESAVDWTIPYALPEKRAWQAAPALKDAPLQRVHCPVIDFGDDFAWESSFPGLRGGSTKNDILGLDLDGDGKTNDSITYFEFSMDKPLNQLPNVYKIHEINNGIFYGGGVGYFYNLKPRFSENCINIDYQNMFDDISFNAYAAGKDVAMRVFVSYLWKKEDFLNGGDAQNVSLDAQSQMHVRISRYWKGYTEGRFVVKTDGQFYISEYDFDIQPSTIRSGAPNCQKVHSIHPTSMRWAKWNPTPPYDMEYDPETLVFETIDFEDVTVLGWMAAKTDHTSDACWLKWGGFEAHATVTRPWRPSEAVNMVQPKGESFYIGETEINYETWRRIYKWWVRPQWGMTPGYVFDQDGDMGSIKLGGGSHQAQEPATGLTWYDAVAWCNALSQYEGKTPAYYANAERTEVFHIVKERQDPENLGWKPKVYVDWGADGYRLPTESEWKKSYGSTPKEASSGKNGRTVSVGSGQKNANGLYDMFGSVWEYIWDAGDVFDPALQKNHTVLGGCFRYPVDVSTVPALKYGENLIDGNYNIGFRVLRYEEKGARPPKDFEARAVGYVDADIPEWTFGAEEKIQPASSPSPQISDALKPEMLSVDAGTFKFGKSRKLLISTLPFELAKKEVSYALWNEVYGWALMNGYRFNHDGAVGSMSAQEGNFEFSENEPVTTVGFFDTLIWLNALSEMVGKTPVYYEDKEKTKLLKHSNMFRGDMLVPLNNDKLHSGVAKLFGSKLINTFAFVKWEADGYRLPLESEWEFAAGDGLEKRILLVEQSPSDRQFWTRPNSGGRTMPVGTSLPNRAGFYDLIGNVFEYTLSVPKSEHQLNNPRTDALAAAVKGGSYNSHREKNGKLDRSFYPETSHVGRSKSVVAYPEIGFRIARSEANVQPAVVGKESEKVLWEHPEIAFQQGSMFRGNSRRTGTYPTTGVPSLTGLKWKFNTTHPIESSPTVVGDTVYIGCNDGHLYALDKANGTVRWKFATRGNAPVRSTAAVWKNKVVCFVGNDDILYALDAKTGQKKWEAGTGGGLKDFGKGTSPLLLNDYVFCNGPEGKARAYHAETGAQVWEGNGRAGGMGALSYQQGRLFFGAGSGGVGSSSLRTGRRRPTLTNCAGDTFQDTPVSDGKSVYLVGGQGMQAFMPPETMEKGRLPKANYTYIEPHWNKMHPFFSPSAVDDRHHYVGNLDNFVYAVDKKSGKLAWKFKTGGEVFSGPSVAAGIVYFGSADGKVYALDTKTGREKWSYQTSGEISWSSPTPGDGVLYIGSEDGLYVFE